MSNNWLSTVGVLIVKPDLRAVDVTVVTTEVRRTS